MIVMAIGENVAAKSTEDMGENALSFLQHKRNTKGVTAPPIVEVTSKSYLETEQGPPALPHQASQYTHIESLLSFLINHVYRTKTIITVLQTNPPSDYIHFSFSLGRSSSSVSKVNGSSATGCRGTDRPNTQYRG